MEKKDRAGTHSSQTENKNGPINDITFITKLNSIFEKLKENKNILPAIFLLLNHCIVSILFTTNYMGQCILF